MISSVVKKVKETHTRIFLYKTTATFFCFSLILCLAQGIIQSFLLTIDSEYKDLLHDTISAVDHLALKNLTQIDSELHIEVIKLTLCNDIPIGRNRWQENCTLIFNTASPLPSSVLSPIIMKQIRIDPTEGAVAILGEDNSTTNVTEACAQTLLYAYQNIRNFSSEDLTFIILQFWLLVTSVFAIANDSVPHIWTVLIIRALSTAWSIYSLWRTQNFQIIFRKLYADSGTPCGIDFFSIYFRDRRAYEIPDLALNATGFSVACWLSWRLLRMYNAQAMRHIGAPEHINRINKLRLAVFSCLQLEVFILVTVMGLWVDVLVNTAIRRLSEHFPAYLGGFIANAIVLIPWIAVGWYSIKGEIKKGILLFFFLAFGIIIGWSLMFDALVYRWVFLQWPFLAGCSITSFVLIISSTVLTIICRLNFGRGLKQYLEAEAALARSGFASGIFRHDEERNTPFDLDDADCKQSAVSPTSASSKYEVSMPTYLPQPLLHDQTGSVGIDTNKGRKVNEQGAPVSKLAERNTAMLMRSLPKYDVRYGEAF